MATNKFFSLSPAAAALIYPALLTMLYMAAAQRNVGMNVVGVGVMTLILVIAMPALTFIVAKRLAEGEPTASAVQDRWIAHAAFAAPPLFTFTGVLTYMAGFGNADYWLWLCAWAVGLVMAYPNRRKTPSQYLPRVMPTWLGPAHGIVAGLLILGFIVLHFANHLVGLWSAEAHISLMDKLREWYRSPFVEPLLILLMFFMIGSGFILLRARLARRADFFATLQSLTGIYLLCFIPGHMNSVFIFQRMFMDKQTDFWFASGGPAGLLGDSWSVRLIPHYLLGVWALTTHAACGLRQVLLAHGFSVAKIDRVVILISILAAIAAAAMVLGLCRVHIGE